MSLSFLILIPYDSRLDIWKISSILSWPLSVTSQAQLLILVLANHCFSQHAIAELLGESNFPITSEHPSLRPLILLQSNDIGPSFVHWLQISFSCILDLLTVGLGLRLSESPDYALTVLDKGRKTSCELDHQIVSLSPLFTNPHFHHLVIWTYRWEMSWSR